MTANPSWSTGGEVVGHMAEPCAGCILQAGSMKDFAHEGQGYSAAFSVGLSQAGTPQSSSPRFSQLLNTTRAGAAFPGCQAPCDRAAPQCSGSTASVCLCWGCLTRKPGPNSIFQGDQMPAGCRCRADGAEMHVVVGPVPASSACSAFVPAVGPHTPWQLHGSI